MRILILFANPIETSFGAALHRQVLESLGSRHQVDDCDLYAESFAPIMSRQDRADYHDTAVNQSRVSSYTKRLLDAEALILMFPVWNEGFPAILKGFFDRVFLPGVSFKMGADGSVTPGLENLRKLAAVSTYGSDHVRTFLLGDAPRRIVKRFVRATPAHRVSCDYIAHYDMNHTTPERRAAFISRVKRIFQAW